MSDIGHDIMTTSVNQNNGAISAQIGDAVNGEVVCDNAEWWQHVGFASRPSRAERGASACQVLSHETSGRDICYSSRDLRSQKAAAALKEGETIIFASGPNGAGTGSVHLHDDGSAARIDTIVKNGNGSGGADVKLSVSSDGTVTLDAGNGTNIVVSASGSVNVSASASVSVDAPSVSLGGSGGIPVVTDAGSLLAWITTVSAALTNLGIPNVPPVTITSLKVTAA